MAYRPSESSALFDVAQSINLIYLRPLQYLVCWAPTAHGKQKLYTPFLERITPGSVWHFRLVANPTKSCVSEPGKRGKVHAHVSVPHQKEWLQTRAAHNGFSLNEEDFTVVHSQWHIFCKNSSQEAQVRLLAVTYEGVLTVTDTELFCKEKR